MQVINAIDRPKNPAVQGRVKCQIRFVAGIIWVSIGVVRAKCAVLLPGRKYGASLKKEVLVERLRSDPALNHLGNHSKKYHFFLTLYHDHNQNVFGLNSGADT